MMEAGDDHAGMLGLLGRQTQPGRVDVSREPVPWISTPGPVLGGNIFFPLGKDKFAFFTLNFMDTKGSSSG